MTVTSAASFCSSLAICAAVCFWLMNDPYVVRMSVASLCPCTSRFGELQFLFDQVDYEVRRNARAE